ncbi:MAG: TonB-dependent receptor plug domain-containing protein, partial [Bryobacteraceae bacterium]
FDPKRIRLIPGINLDDRLRSVPGFSLFRRSSGIVAHPTTQGVSLRGIGSSGASRSLVLWDGIPANDPFGGWVYWTRFAPEEVSRIEISRGASTSVFGDRALGGAIALFSPEPERRHFRASYEAGNENSHDVSAGYSDLWPRFGVSAFGRAFTTGGYFIIPASRRGSIDRPAGVRFVSSNARADYFGSADRLYFKTDILVEDRQNGTPIQTNSTALGTVSLRYQREAGGHNVSLLGFHTREEFRSGFSAIAASRNTETLSYRQTVPAEATGGALVWGLPRRQWNLLGGADVFRVAGTSTDSLFPAGKRIGGGTLLQHGVFLQGDASVGIAKFFAGARHQFAGQDEKFFSPSAGAVLGRGRVRARGSVYRSFRAPTLNELYREFRAGNAVTQANPQLRPETLFGAEAGFDFAGETTRARLTFYRNQLRDLITNVTLQSTPALIVRQRRNAAEALNRGVEFDAARRFGPIRGEMGYLFVDSRFGNARRVPQIPRHQGSALVAFEKNGTLVTAGVRSFAAQFEDELNTFVLGGFATVQVLLRQRLTPHLSAVAAFENLLDREYLTGFSPTPTIGAPRLWRIGLRWQ